MQATADVVEVKIAPPRNFRADSHRPSRNPRQLETGPFPVQAGIAASREGNELLTDVENTNQDGA